MNSAARTTIRMNGNKGEGAHNGDREEDCAVGDGGEDVGRKGCTLKFE